MKKKTMNLCLLLLSIAKHFNFIPTNINVINKVYKMCVQIMTIRFEQIKLKLLSELSKQLQFLLSLLTSIINSLQKVSNWFVSQPFS